jgi:phosphoketolase
MTEALENATPLSIEKLRTVNAYWSACNYLAAGMIYLRANPLLREPLARAHRESIAGPLGLGSRSIVHVGSPQPIDQEI